MYATHPCSHQVLHTSRELTGLAVKTPCRLGCPVFGVQLMCPCILAAKHETGLHTVRSGFTRQPVTLTSCDMSKGKGELLLHTSNFITNVS